MQWFPCKKTSKISTYSGNLMHAFITFNNNTPSLSEAPVNNFPTMLWITIIKLNSISTPTPRIDNFGIHRALKWLMWWVKARWTDSRNAADDIFRIPSVFYPIKQAKGAMLARKWTTHLKEPLNLMWMEWFHDGVS
ncbi:hypothetical protein V6N13_142848 [Hibiscus sabdariffa]